MLRGLFSRGFLYDWINQLQSSPLDFFISILIEVPALLMALILHEVAHGYVALRCGDPTARMMGRLSLNPARHLDPFGTLCMLMFGFGWAKPVPVNPRNFRNYRRDDLLVSLAGITMNLCLFLVSSFFLVLVSKAWDTNASVSQFVQYIYRFLYLFSLLNLTLAIFNLLPIPPLDGYHVLDDTVLKGRLHLSREVMIGFQIGLIVLLFSTDVVGNLITDVRKEIWDFVIKFYGNILY